MTKRKELLRVRVGANERGLLRRLWLDAIHKLTNSVSRLLSLPGLSQVPKGQRQALTRRRFIFEKLMRAGLLYLLSLCWFVPQAQARTVVGYYQAQFFYHGTALGVSGLSASPWQACVDTQASYSSVSPDIASGSLSVQTTYNKSSGYVGIDQNSGFPKVVWYSCTVSYVTKTGVKVNNQLITWIYPVCAETNPPYKPSGYNNSCPIFDTNPGPKNLAPPPCGSVGNPINPATGDKYQTEIDYQGSGKLGFSRHYHSSVIAQTGSVGSLWQHNYENRIYSDGNTIARIMRATGEQVIYKPNANGVWLSDGDINNPLIHSADGGWQLTTANDEVETYDANGNLSTIKDRSGYTQTLSYSAVPTTNPLMAGLLISVTDTYNHTLTFSYDSYSRINTLTDSSGNIIQYGYDTNNNLVSVAYPDSTVRTYRYNEAAYTAGANLPHALTGIIDENNNRYATYSYDANGKAISTEHAGGIEKYRLNYGSNVTTITDALGTNYSRNFTTILGVLKSTDQSQPGGSGCGASASTLTYDANGNVASRTDFNGNRSNYRYDLTRNLETSRTEGLTATGTTTPATRSTTTEWHPSFRLPVKITTANLETTYAYTSQGDISQKTLKDLADNSTRTWNISYTYSDTVPGALLKKVEDGPRTDIADLTTYDYYPPDAACVGGHLGCRGQLQQVTDALGHISQIPRYSAHGQPEQLIDPNGLVTTLVYDVRQRLLSSDVGGETTRYSYTLTGLISRVTQPDGSYLAYSYDNAHRLIKVQDPLGNTLSYTLDALGNRIKEELLDPSGQLARSQSRVYDALSRLQNLVLPQ